MLFVCFVASQFKCLKYTLTWKENTFFLSFCLSFFRCDIFEIIFKVIFVLSAALLADYYYLAKVFSLCNSVPVLQQMFFTYQVDLDRRVSSRDWIAPNILFKTERFVSLT